MILLLNRSCSGWSYYGTDSLFLTALSILFFLQQYGMQYSLVSDELYFNSMIHRCDTISEREKSHHVWLNTFETCAVCYFHTLRNVLQCSGNWLNFPSWFKNQYGNKILRETIFYNLSIILFLIHPAVFSWHDGSWILLIYWWCRIPVDWSLFLAVIRLNINRILHEANGVFSFSTRSCRYLFIFNPWVIYKKGIRHHKLKITSAITLEWYF